MKSILILAFLLASLCLRAQPSNLKKLNAFIDYVEHHNRGRGALAIYKNGQPVYSRRFGVASDQVSKAPVTFQMGSITKLLTATLIFRLIEKGELRLTDSLSTFFPEIPNAGTITIQQLLEHTSGLGDYVAKKEDPFWLKKPATEAQIKAEIIRQGSLFKPGQEVAYSNSGYYLLARIVEKKYQQPYEQVLAKEITEPLGLVHTASARAKPSNVAPSYQYKQGRWEKVQDFVFTNVVGVGDVASTPAELNQLITAFFQHQLLRPMSVASMKPDPQRNIPGKGLEAIPFYNQTFYGHAGDTYGTHALVGYNQRDSVSIACVINGERYPHNQFMVQALTLFYGKDIQYPAFSPEVALAPKALNSFTGVYASPAIPLKLTIRREGRLLTAQGTDQPRFFLEAYGPHAFRFEPDEITIEFIGNQMLFRQGPEVITLTKE